VAKSIDVGHKAQGVNTPVTPEKEEHRAVLLGSVAILGAAFLWSLDALLRRKLYTLPSLVVVFSEHALGFLFLAPMLYRRRSQWRALTPQTWIALFWVALFGGVLGTLFYTKALSYVHFIDFSVVVLLQKLQPVFALYLAHILLKERLRRDFYLWAVVALGGSYLITFPQGLPVLVGGGKNLVAGLLAVGAAFAWGSSTVMGKYSLKNLDTWVVTPLRLGLTTTVIGLYLLGTGKIEQLALVSPLQLGYLLAIVFSSGTTALAIYYFGLKRVDASRSTILEMFWPISAVALDWLVFDRVLTWSQWIGAALLLVAIYRITRPELASTENAAKAA